MYNKFHLDQKGDSPKHLKFGVKNYTTKKRLQDFYITLILQDYITLMPLTVFPFFSKIVNIFRKNFDLLIFFNSCFLCCNLLRARIFRRTTLGRGTVRRKKKCQFQLSQDRSNNVRLVFFSFSTANCPYGELSYGEKSQS